MRVGKWTVVAQIVFLSVGAPFIPKQQPPMRALVPELRIVSSDSIPQAELSILADILVAPDGYVYAFDSKGCEFGCVRLYDASGKLVRSFGRLGDGPSEFTTAIDIFSAAGDSVLIFDRGKSKMHVFRRNGTFVRTHDVPKAGRGGDRVLRGYLSSGRAVVEVGYWHWPVQDSSAIRITDSTTREIRRIAAWKASKPPAVSAIGLVFGTQPFLPAARSAQDPVGGRSLVALPSGVFGGRPGQVKVVVVNNNGVTSERILDLAARRMTGAVVEAFIKRQLDYKTAQIKSSGTPRPALEKNLRDQLIVGEYLPEIDNALLGSDGSIWLKLHDVNEWVIVSPAGTIVGRVQVPSGTTVKQVSLDRMWAINFDSDGVPAIVRYKVS